MHAGVYKRLVSVLDVLYTYQRPLVFMVAITQPCSSEKVKSIVCQPLSLDEAVQEISDYFEQSGINEVGLDTMVSLYFKYVTLTF